MILHEFDSIAALVRAMMRGKVSPRDVIDESLARAEQTQSVTHAFIALMHDQAREAAKRAEKRIQSGDEGGSLAGVPVTVKDLIQTRGTPTTGGSKRYPPTFGVERDATVVGRLRRAGAIVLGKTNLHELALGVTSVNEHYGAVANPWNPERVAGGSSGGSAVAVALGAGIASLGTDTRGSIRIPASCCGITGFKPTYGLVPTEGVLALAPSLDHVGPMTRSVEDAVTILAVIAGARGVEIAGAVSTSIRALRIGVSARLLADLDPRIAAVIQDAVRDLGALAYEVRDVQMPELDKLHEASGVLAGSEAYREHEEALTRDPGAFGPIVRHRLASGHRFTAEEVAWAEEQRTAARNAFDRVFAEVDLLVGAVLPTVAPTIASQLDNLDTVTETVRLFTRLNADQNMVGLPALSIPCGFVDGMPIGLQIVGPRNGDATVLSAGVAFQRATEWHRRAPSWQLA